MTAKSLQTPLATVRRLCVYKRYLEKLRLVGQDKTSSLEMSEYTGIPSYQIRKDINYLGEVGIVGRGYRIADLVAHITSHLGLDKDRRCVLVGMGALGTALVHFFSVLKTPYRMVAGFDVDKGKIGTSVNGVEVLPLSELAGLAERERPEIGIITVPASEAQAAANAMIDTGIRALLNFTPAILSVPAPVVKRDIDLTFEIETLSYLLECIT